MSKSNFSFNVIEIDCSEHIDYLKIVEALDFLDGAALHYFFTGEGFLFWKKSLCKSSSAGNSENLIPGPLGSKESAPFFYPLSGVARNFVAKTAFASIAWRQPACAGPYNRA